MSRLRKTLTLVIVVSFFAAASLSLLNLIFPLPQPRPYSLLVEDRNGKFLQAFLADDGIWRLRTSPEEIPAKLRRILIQKEDRYFYYHPGVNPFAVVRALVQNVVSGRRTSGASTITMQVARMLEPKQRTYVNKIVEMFRALQLELKYTKKEILEMYLSMVPLGGNIEGLKSASLVYYQTPPERLNIAQLFDLIVIPTDPNNLRPDRYPQRLYEERKRRALPLMRSGVLSQQDSIVIWQTDAAAVRTQLPKQAPHFCLRIREQFAKSNQRDVRSSLDLNLQKTTERLLSNHLRSWKRQGVMNGAVLVIENRTKEIRAYVGSENFDDADAQGQIDAVRALRSPGSTLKPFLYALEMDRGVLTPKTQLLDVPYDAEGFLAENYDGKYSGLVPADDALRHSLNVPMIRLLRDVGVQQFVSFVTDAGIASLQSQKEKLGLSVILGGCGITLEELTGAYSSFPSGGVYTTPQHVKVSGNERQSGRQVFSASAAYMVTDILSGLSRPDLPNNFESSMNLPKVAFKTGTSYGRRDAWSIGYSAEYTVGVWIGNVTHRGNPELTGSRAAAPLLIDIFNTISTTSQKAILPQPSDLLTREVCTKSGLLPTRFCKHVIEDYYSVRRTLNCFCEFDRELLVSRDGKVQYCPSCLGRHDHRVTTSDNYPPELLSYWISIGKKYQTPPPHNPECAQLLPGEGPKILSPTENMTYYVFSPKQKIVLQASSDVEVKEQNWYLDERFIGKEKANNKLFVSLKDGEHSLTCVDDRGRMTTVKILVKYVL